MTARTSITALIGILMGLSLHPQPAQAHFIDSPFENELFTNLDVPIYPEQPEESVSTFATKAAASVDVPTRLSTKVMSLAAFPEGWTNSIQ